MPRLADLQSDMAAFALSQPGPAADARLTGTVEPGRIPAERRLAVYKNNVYARLVEALAETFPAVRRLVGADFFRCAAVEYLVAHPPRTRTLLGYGHAFPAFIEQFSPAASVPYLADVARLEWLYLEAYHAPEAVPASGGVVRGWLSGTLDAADFGLHPSARLMRSVHPVSRIWEINRGEDPIEGRVRIDGGPEHLLVIRPDAVVEVRRLHASVHAAVEAIARGEAPASARARAQANADIDVGEHLAALAHGATFC